MGGKGKRKSKEMMVMIGVVIDSDVFSVQPFFKVSGSIYVQWDSLPREWIISLLFCKS